jgi:hypothetical protein
MEDRRFGERREFNPYRLSKMKADEERGYVDHNLKVNVRECVLSQKDH